MIERLFATITAWALLPAAAFAVSTETWKLQSAADFRAGKLERVVVSSEGEVSLGRQVTRAAVKDESLIWSLARDASGALYVGGGPKGRVYRVKNPGDE